MTQRRRTAKTSSKGSRGGGSHGPQLSPHTHATIQSDADLAEQGVFADVTLRECDLAGQRAEDLLLERVVCQRVRLGECQLALAQVLDVRFEGCDLAGSVWEKPELRRVELEGCRAIGLTLTDASLDDVRFQRCNAEHLRLWSSSLRSVRFEHCVLRAASFMESDLSGTVFRRCDLTGADLRGTKLAGADLRGSTLTGVQLGIAEIRGAIIDPAQAVHLAGLLGVTVQEEESEEAASAL
jgi:uncharacterized protein YjbI with pentapeptide repeats